MTGARGRQNPPRHRAGRPGRLRRLAEPSILRRLNVALFAAVLLPMIAMTALGLHVTNEYLQSHVRDHVRERGSAFRTALDYRGESNGDQVTVNGEWDALCEAVDRRDRRWIEANATSWVVAHTAMTGARVLDRRGRVLSAAGDLVFRSVTVDALVSKVSRQGMRAYDLAILDGRLLLVSAGPIRSQQEGAKPVRGVILYSERVNGDLLSELAPVIGAENINVYVGGTLVGSSGSFAGWKLPAGAELGRPALAGDTAELFDTLRDNAGNQVGVVHLTVENAALMRSSHAIMYSALVILVLAMIAASFAALRLTRMFTSPLRKLLHATRGLTESPESRPSVDIRSDDEFGELAASFNYLSASLARTFAELQQRDTRDALTGLLNSRAVDNVLHAELSRSRRTGGAFSILVLGIDEYKLFCETHGHAAGEELLLAVARALEDHLDSTGAVGRTADDEFCVILAGATAAEAETTGFGILDVLLDTPFLTPKGETIPIRVSVGVADYPERGRTAEELRIAAERHLSVSKKRGGNVVSGAHITEDEDADTAGAFTMLDSMNNAVDNKDSYTLYHARDVAAFAEMIAVQIGLGEEARKTLHTAALLHDVGKIGVPGRLLRKPGGLTEQEYDVVKQHVALGASIIAGVPSLAHLAPIVAAHHERFDGLGYPQGLAGEDIPLLGRILAVADACSAMVTDRPYRKGMPVVKAFEELRANAGTQFDPALVEALLVANEGWEFALD